MTLATVDADGLPDARVVLCKGADQRGLVFYTNIESAKGRELKGQPRAAALFHWKSLRRQVRFRGPISEVSAAESDAYFASRPRGSQIGAWASAAVDGRSPRAAISKRRWKLTSGSSEAATCHDRTIGAAIGSIRWRSSSGATAPPDCTSVSGLPARGPNRPGTSGSFTPDEAGATRVSQTFMAAEIAEAGAVVRRQLAANSALDREAGCGLTRAEASVRRDGRARQLRSCGALSQAPGRA